MMYRERATAAGFGVPISFSRLADCKDCSLHAWSITDRQALVRAVSWLYLAKPRHARRVLEGLKPGHAAFGGSEFDNAIAQLTVKRSDLEAALQSSDDTTAEKAQRQLDARIAIRDGLLFQHISWVAAARSNASNIQLNPHPRPANKGFDSLILHIDKNSVGLSNVVICEDKATTNPRDTVREEVWPEFEQIAAGQRDNEILADVTSILERQSLDVDNVLESVLWKNVLSFRASIAFSPVLKPTTLLKLFAGYENVVGVPIERRAGECLPMSDLRADLESFAQAVQNELLAQKSEQAKKLPEMVNV